MAAEYSSCPSFKNTVKTKNLSYANNDLLQHTLLTFVLFPPSKVLTTDVDISFLDTEHTRQSKTAQAR